MSEPEFADLTSHTFVSQRLKLRYVDWGNGDFPPLLLIYGGRDHCRNWDWVAKELRPYFHIIAPDLRGHGDSDWSPDGNYSMAAFLYDLAQLIHQQKLAPVTIIAHSLGGMIATRYAGLFPEHVRRLVTIEGLGMPPKLQAERAKMTTEERFHKWIDAQRELAARQPRRYASIEDAFERMHQENSHLSPAQARHLTVHGINQNEDGTYSWKFDNYVRAITPVDIPQAEVDRLWSRITCPVLFAYGRESWATNPEDDGRIDHFQNGRLAMFDNAGHWVHHDQLDQFIAEVKAFLEV